MGNPIAEGSTVGYFASKFGKSRTDLLYFIDVSKKFRPGTLFFGKRGGFKWYKGMDLFLSVKIFIIKSVFFYLQNGVMRSFRSLVFVSLSFITDSIINWIYIQHPMSSNLNNLFLSQMTRADL